MNEETPLSDERLEALVKARLEERAREIDPKPLLDRLQERLATSSRRSGDSYATASVNARRRKAGSGNFIGSGSRKRRGSRRCWSCLLACPQRGGHVNSTDIKKHKNDVFRLLAIVDSEYSVMIPTTIALEMATFAARMAAEKVDLKSLGLVGVTQDEMIAQFQALYVRH